MSACFRIIADIPKDLAVRAWDSQWDAILLGAINDSEIGFNFQSNIPPEEFSDASEFRITNYAFKGLNREKSTSEEMLLG